LWASRRLTRRRGAPQRRVLRPPALVG